MSAGGSQLPVNGVTHRHETYDEIKEDDERPSKKARNFIARQVSPFLHQRTLGKTRARPDSPDIGMRELPIKKNPVR